MTALARLLVDFGAPQERSPRLAVVPFAEVAPDEPANLVDLDAACAAARAEGVAEGRAAAAAETEARLAALAAEHAAERDAALAAARAAWARDEAEPLAARLDQAFAALREEVEEGVAAALRPLAQAGAARQAARLMAGEIARLLAAARDAPPLEIAGPADLIDAVRDALDADPRVGAEPAREGRVRFVEADGVDAFARIGRAEVETRLVAFARALDPES